MKVLLDHCTPKQFGFLLTGHFVRTAEFMKWDRLVNGELLAAAATEFEVFITTDKRIESQQHASNLPLPVIVLIAINNRIQELTPLAPETLRLLSSPLQKRVYRVQAPGSTSS